MLLTPLRHVPCAARRAIRSSGESAIMEPPQHAMPSAPSPLSDRDMSSSRGRCRRIRRRLVFTSSPIAPCALRNIIAFDGGLGSSRDDITEGVSLRSAVFDATRSYARAGHDPNQVSLRAGGPALV